MGTAFRTAVGRSISSCHRLKLLLCHVLIQSNTEAAQREASLKGDLDAALAEVALAKKYYTEEREINKEQRGENEALRAQVERLEEALKASHRRESAAWQGLSETRLVLQTSAITWSHSLCSELSAGKNFSRTDSGVEILLAPPPPPPPPNSFRRESDGKLESAERLTHLGRELKTGDVNATVNETEDVNGTVNGNRHLEDERVLVPDELDRQDSEENLQEGDQGEEQAR